MAWFGKKYTSTISTSSSAKPLRLIEEFLLSYDQSGSARSKYAMTLWGISAAFVEIFGSLDQYHNTDGEKKLSYLRMIGQNAIAALDDGDEIEASCNQVFVNFLVATDGIQRRNLRGSIALFADRLDGIFDYGKAEIDRIGQLEEDAKEFFASEAPFPIGTGVVHGGVTEQNVVIASQLIINDLQKILRTDFDYYTYIVEQQARLRLEPGIRTMLDGVPLFEIEFRSLGHDWSVDSPRALGVDYIESIRPDIRRWCIVTVPSLDPDELSLRVIGAAFGHFRNVGKVHFDRIRRAYAEHFRDECLQKGQRVDAAEWDDVVRAL
ncbi:hypothetical protein V6U71_05625 [Sphingopyxis sp. J-6]|uniref:hypothetical protein n=1 Tax=Sphingopyxis sp. J-6 TaxID=3122054 RepID=UPI0039844E53